MTNALTPGGLSHRARLALLWGAAGLAVAALFATRLPQPRAYHLFADTRTCLGIPNFTNVSSNLAFVLAGLAGLAWLGSQRGRLVGTRFLERRELYLYGAFFAAAIGVGLGSGYYHWAPSNPTLFWDRLPMTLVVAALAGGLAAERFGGRTGVAMFVVLALFLPGTLVYWRASEAAGAENVWPYLAGLNGTLAVVALMVLLFPSRYTQARHVLIALVLYAVAMLFDTLLDQWFFSLARIMGGHAFKHIVAALSMFWLLWFVLRRRVPRGLLT